MASGHPRGKWLFVRYRSGERELYDLVNDEHLLENGAQDLAMRPTRRALEAELLRRLGGRYPWPHI